MDLQLKGKTALISGSSKGIGLSIATCLYNEGCNVVINSRHANRLRAASKEIGSNASYFVADVTKNSECKKLVEHTVKTFGSIDILICNVGDGNSPKPGDEQISDWKKMLDINLNSTINLVSASEKYLKKTSGSIV